MRIEEAPGEDIDSHVLAEQLTEMYADDEKDKCNVSVVSSGMAAEHSLIGMLNFSFYDIKRKKVRLKQAGRGGIGTVFTRQKDQSPGGQDQGVTRNRNNVVDMDPIKERGRKFQQGNA